MMNNLLRIREKYDLNESDISLLETKYDLLKLAKALDDIVDCIDHGMWDLNIVRQEAEDILKEVAS